MKDTNYFANMCILFCRPTQTQKHFQEVPSWYLLLDLAALNENFDRQYNMKMWLDQKFLEHVIDHLPWGTL